MKLNEKAVERMLGQAHERGLCDEREIVFFATASLLPRGEYGLVCLCLKENDLIVCGGDMSSRIGEILYRIPLSRTADLRFRRSLVGRRLCFSYEGEKYEFTNFIPTKELTAAVEGEAAK